MYLETWIEVEFVSCRVGPITVPNNDSQQKNFSWCFTENYLRAPPGIPVGFRGSIGNFFRSSSENLYRNSTKNSTRSSTGNFSSLTGNFFRRFTRNSCKISIIYFSTLVLMGSLIPQGDPTETYPEVPQKILPQVSLGILPEDPPFSRSSHGNPVSSG